jgi:uncharacterized ion transporter superfamily protein YfcC
MFNKDVATGKNPAVNTSTTGPASAFSKSNVPGVEGLTSCYLWDVLETCTDVQKEILQNGSAIVEDFILVGYKQANGSAVLLNGTNVGGSGTTVSPSAAVGTTSSAAGSTTALGSTIRTSLLLATALVGLQTLLL